MKKDPGIFLEHIVESIHWIEEYTTGISRDEFFNSPKTQDAVIRRLEIIGEAVKHIPDNFKNRHQNIPWRKASGMRDILIHEYFGVDLDLLWNLLEKDLKDFCARIEALLQER